MGASVAGGQFWCDIYGVIFLYLDRDPGEGAVGQREHGSWVGSMLGAVEFPRDLAEQLQAAPLLPDGAQGKAHVAVGHTLDVDGVGPGQQRPDLSQQAIGLDDLLGLLRLGQRLWQMGDLVPVESRL